ALVAELAPRPDVAPSIRRLPTVAVTAAPIPTVATTSSPAPSLLPSPLPPVPRPIIETTSPERYRVQFTMGKDGHDTLRRLQALLRREIPSGDPAAIVERALALLLEKVEKAKFAATPKPKRSRSIRPGTDRVGTAANSRDIPSDVQRAVWRRDGGQCGFVGKNGHRCT